MSAQPLPSHLKSVALTLVCTVVPAVLLVAIVFFLSEQSGVPFSNFSRDPNSVANLPFYIGAISQIGILLWCASAAVCFLTFLVFIPVFSQLKPALFFLYGGFLSTVLLLDDAFLVHEKIAPRFLNIEENVTFLIYGLIGLGFLVIFRQTILRTEYLMLLISLLFFASSLLADKMNDYDVFAAIGIHSVSVIYSLEDGLKFIGIAAWLGYFTRTSLLVLKPKHQE